MYELYWALIKKRA